MLFFLFSSDLIISDTGVPVYGLYRLNILHQFAAILNVFNVQRKSYTNKSLLQDDSNSFSTIVKLN